MIGIPLGLVAANAIEWVVHKHVLHGLGRHTDSIWSFHWHEHHRACRKNGHLDADYERPVWGQHAQGKEALALATKQDDERMTAQAQANLAELDRMEGNFEAAESGMRAALEVLEAHDDRSSIRSHNAEFGMFLIELGRLEGVEILRKVAAEYEGLNKVLLAASAWLNLSLYHLDHGEPEPFHKLNDDAYAVFMETGYADAQAACILNRAFLHLGCGEVLAAHKDLLEAGNEFPINFESGTDLEAGILRAWLALLMGDKALAQRGSEYFAKVAPTVRQLLGPMTHQLQQVLAVILDEDWPAAAKLMADQELPCSVTYRVIWRSMNAYVTARTAD